MHAAGKLGNPDKLRELLAYCLKIAAADSKYYKLPKTLARMDDEEELLNEIRAKLNDLDIFIKCAREWTSNEDRRNYLSYAESAIKFSVRRWFELAEQTKKVEKKGNNQVIGRDRKETIEFHKRLGNKMPYWVLFDGDNKSLVLCTHLYDATRESERLTDNRGRVENVERGFVEQLLNQYEIEGDILSVFHNSRMIVYLYEDPITDWKDNQEM